MATVQSTATCPVCGESAARPILYGMPGSEAFEASERGELVLGGCLIGEADPDVACGACGHRWQSEAR
ncbi:MAG: hypothetical protein QOI89_50 [Solirubrobacteraceae bacterium]|jgi:hypothetical protein|nr:hypothetical protein [Solirubrobacteraceae bacterium]